jgi:hypothetical protein
MGRILVVLLALASILTLVGVGGAIVPPYMSYQGSLTDSEGNPLDGTYDMTFRIYSGGLKSGGGDSPLYTLRWTEEHRYPVAVEVDDGLFNVELGRITPFPKGLFYPERALYLSIQVGNDPEMEPHIRLATSPWAFKSEMAESSTVASRAHVADSARVGIVPSDGDWAIDGATVYRANGNVGIGTDDPSTFSKLHVVSGDKEGHMARSTINISTGARKNYGVRGSATGTTVNTTNYGVYGDATGAETNWAGYFSGSVHVTHRLGIGEEEPLTGIHVTGPNYPESFIIMESESGGDAGLGFHEGSTPKWGIFNDETLNGLKIWNNDLYPVFFAEQISGYVGLGTTSPGANLEVVSTASNSRVLSVLASDGSDMLKLNETSGGHSEMYLCDADGDTKVRLSSNSYCTFSNNVGIGVSFPSEELTVKGNILLLSVDDETPVLELGQGLDYAEGFDVTDAAGIEPGSVLCIDPDNPGNLTISSEAYDNRVAGIVAGGRGLGSGVRLGLGEFDHDVALAGRVYCNVIASESSIEPGDLLTTSDVPGHAMKAIEHARAHGAILGKAMERLDKGETGQILVLVTLH